MINVIDDKCNFCSACISVCPVDCIDVLAASININHRLCIDCNLCVYICPIEVLEQNYEKKV